MHFDFRIIGSFHQAKQIAGAFNPLLSLFLLAAVANRMRQAADFRAAPFLSRTMLALGATYVIAHLNRWAHLWRAQPHFPSGHITFALCIAASLGVLNRRYWWLAAPAITLYGALGYHSWFDVGGALFSPFLTIWIHQSTLRGHGKTRPNRPHLPR